ncbi:hypothetical protein RUND412_011097 [Rhizina undulata]
MQQSILNDAALALSRILTFHRVQHGFFGGFAILAKGARHRESKDLDVLVSATKEEIVSILSSKRGWLEIPQSREDYVAFFWNNAEFSPRRYRQCVALDSDSESECEDDMKEVDFVLVEMFVGQKRGMFPGVRNQVLRGNHMGTSYVQILEEAYLFRGKINACATRGKQSDVQDVAYLIANYGSELKDVAKSMDKRVIGLALKRHPQLTKDLRKLGVGCRGARWGVRGVKVEDRMVPGCWDVQRGLGCLSFL